MQNPGKDLRAREEALLEPAVRRDHSQVEKLLAEDFQEFGSSGRVWARHEIFELLANEAYLPVWIEDFHCALLADDLALVTYRAVRTGVGPDGRSSSLRSSIWTNKSGEWRLRFHQGTRIP